MGMGPTSGLGVWSSGDKRLGRRTLVDMERGIKPGMAPPLPSHLCPHKLNPIACLECFRAKAIVSTAPPKPKVPVNPVVAAIKQKMANEQPKQGPVHVGVMPDGTPVPRPVPQSGQTRGKMPVPVLHPTAAQGGTGVATKTIEPFTYSTSWDVDGKGLPPERRSLIDSLPRHPDAGKR